MMMMINKLALASLILIPIGCGGGGDDPPTPVEPARPPAAISIVGGNEQTGDAGGVLPESLSVGVRDAGGQAVPAVSVSWRVSTGSGTVSPATSLTDAQGLAKTSFKVGSSVGKDSVAASIANTAIAPALFGATVRPGPAAVVTVTPPTLALQIGRSQALSATLKDVPGNAIAGATFTWTSSAPGVASVSALGVVSTLTPGSATITATSQGKSGVCLVTVSPGPVAAVTLQATQTAFYAADTVTLVAVSSDSAGNRVPGVVITWSTSAPAVATISATGLLTAIAKGSATITATVNARSATVTIRVDEHLGIYSETLPRLRPDIETYFGTFSGSGASLSDFRADNAIKMEGNESLRITISSSGTGFAGWYVAWGDSTRYADDTFTRDMSRFGGGSLRLWMRSATAANFELGIRSGPVAAGSETSKILLSQLGLVAGPTWQRVCLPLLTLTGPSPLADLSRIKILWLVAVSQKSGGTGGIPVTIWFDDIRWDTRPC